MSIETIKARLTPEQLKDLEDPRMSIINFCSNEDLEREYQEIAQKVREMPEEDLTIYHEEDLTEQERLWATVARAEADRETMARWPGDCLLGAMAGKPTGRAGMFRRGPENRAGTFVRRSCRASGSAVGSSGGSGQAARARGAERCGRWPVAHRVARQKWYG